MILPILPLFVRHAGGSYAEVGLITAVFWAAGLAVRYPIGKLSDRIGRKGLILGSQLVYAAATAAFAVSPSPLWFVVLRAVQGAAAGSATVLAMAAVADFVPAERRGRARAESAAGPTRRPGHGPLARGSATLNTEPTPTALRTPTRPPIASTRIFTIQSPRPKPP